MNWTLVGFAIVFVIAGAAAGSYLGEQWINPRTRNREVAPCVYGALGAVAGLVLFIVVMLLRLLL